MLWNNSSIHTLFNTEMRRRFLLQVVFTLSSFYLSKAQDVSGPGHSCLRWSLDSDGRTRVTFLREDDAPGVRSLYLSLWSDDMRLVSCEVNTDPVVTERYRALCDRSSTQYQNIAPKFHIRTLLSPDAPCARVPSSAPKFTRSTRRDGPKGKARKKRAWILPGTLWCGKGSGAVRYEQLGMFENTDRCCREHDHCQHIIHPFRVNYGVFNPNFYTVSHCDCDQRFRQCLLGVNDTISSMVGYSFFNILRVPCFELKPQRRCTEIYWWGMCKVAKEAPYAVFKSSLPYNPSDTISNVTTEDNADTNKSASDGQHVTERPVINAHRRSPKSDHRCGSRDPPRGDTFHHRRIKGKACKRHSTMAPTRMPTISKSQTTTPSMKMGLLNVSKSRALTTNKKRVGQTKTTRKSLSIHPTRSQVSPQATNCYPQTSSTTKSTLSSTQKPTRQLHTSITAVTKPTKMHKKVPKHSHCCRSRTPLRDDSFRPHCKSCSEQETISNMATVTPATTINALHVNVTTLWTLRHKKATEAPKQDKLGNTTTFLMPTARKRQKAASLHKNDKPQKQMDSYLLQDNVSQGPMGSILTQSTHEEKSLKQHNSLRNMTDNHFMCESLKHLDECKYKIPPLEKKYDLKNMESKTAYHCDCTSRLAVQFETLNQASVLPTLLKNFVSQYCFNLPKEKKCHRRKSCSGGFTKASDLLRTLKKIEAKDTAQVQNSGNGRKRGIPVRFYKRCLRLEREAVHMNID